MPEYLDDPSVLTKDKLKSELLANNVELPSGNPTKDVYVQLYLKNLTAQNNKRATATTLDAFSSDEELPMPVVSNRSRSSGRKATRKTDKVQAEELDVTMLSDLALKEELLKHGVDAGPIVASTRKLYEKKLKKLLDDGPVQPELVLTEIQVNYNGNSESDLYSDKEDEVTSEPVAEPVVEPEPAPVVEKSVRSRGKIPVSTSTRSSQHHTRHQLMDAKDHDEDPVLQPKRRSRNSWHALQKVPEDLRPGLTEHVQPHSTRKVSLKPERLARADSPCASSRPVQEPAIEPLRAATRNCSEEQCLGGASKPSRITRVDLVTFSPMCNISPIKRHGSLWSLSDQSRSKPAGVSAAGVEKIAASDQTPKEADNVVLKKLFPNDINSPTGITATCRRPIKGAADRPVKSSDLWSNENVLFSPKTTKTSSSSSSYTESRTINRVTSLPPTAHLKSSTSTSCFSTSSVRPVSAAPPAAQTKVVTQSTSLWIKLFLLAIVGAFLFLVYQAMETNTINPFPDPDAVGVASESKA